MLFTYNLSSIEKSDPHGIYFHLSRPFFFLIITCRDFISKKVIQMKINDAEVPRAIKQFFHVTFRFYLFIYNSDFQTSLCATRLILWTNRIALLRVTRVSIKAKAKLIHVTFDEYFATCKIFLITIYSSNYQEANSTK